MSLELLFVRHAQSLNNAHYDSSGEYVVDCPLTERGHHQAQLVANYLATVHQEKPFDMMYCSPMLRTLQTAQPIAQALDMQPEIWLDIHEIGGVYGRDGSRLYNGKSMSRRDAETQFTEFLLPDEWTDDGWWHRTEPVETRYECYERGVQIAEQLKARARQNADHDVQENILVVTHGMITDCMIRGLMDIPYNEKAYFAHNNTGLTKFLLELPRRTPALMIFMNQVTHLSAEMVSY